jgi:hypothetical protein
MAANPGAKQVFVLGFGSGITSGAVLGHPIDQLTIAENCNPVLEAGENFKAFNRDVLHNQRATIRRDDARTVLKLSPLAYDVIISEPSNPWVAGVGSVFSLEFYELAASKLNEGGIMAQWFHIYEMNDQIVSLVIRTFQTVFPNMEIWDAEEGDIILLGSKKPWLSNAILYSQIFSREEPLKDLTQIGIPTPANLLARQIVSQQIGPALMPEGPVESDDFPILEYAAPMAFFIGDSSLLLFSYDERTFQFQLASKEKRDALRSLPDASVIKTFSSFSTSNQQLLRYFQFKSAQAQLGTNFISGPNMDPVIFKKPEDYKPHPLPPGASDELKKLAMAETALFRDPDHWEAAVKVIVEQLIQTTDHPWKRDYAPARFAETAARVCLAHRKLVLARELINMGLVYDPGNFQLTFLNRVNILFELQAGELQPTQAPIENPFRVPAK